jgi:uroporphyrinogen-III synthase
VEVREAFISRMVDAGSVFSGILEDAGWRVEGKPLIRLYPLPISASPEVDWVFFTSRNGVAYFFSGLAEAGLSVPDAKMAALGPAAANQLIAYGYYPTVVGTGEPLSAAEQLLRYASGARILLPGARRRAGKLPRMIARGATVMLLDVYDNKPVEDPVLIRSQVLVFTSPMNAGSYFSRHSLLAGQQVVAIGPTTAEALLQMGVECRMASRPDEAGLAEAVLRVESGS